MRHLALMAMTQTANDLAHYVFTDAKWTLKRLQKLAEVIHHVLQLNDHVRVCHPNVQNFDHVLVLQAL